jgi:hypothetical protein
VVVVERADVLHLLLVQALELDPDFGEVRADVETRQREVAVLTHGRLPSWRW